MSTPASSRPQLSNASRPLTVEIPAINEHGEVVPTAIAGEHPLTLYVDRREIGRASCRERVYRFV